MSLTAVLVPENQNTQDISSRRDEFVFPREEKKRVFINGVELDATRISGKVVGSRVKQHTQIYATHHNNYMANGDNHVYSSVRSEQWETSEVRLRFEDGKERLFKLPFAISVGEDDLISIVSLYKVNGDGYTAAAQNHNISQSFTQDRNGLQQMCAHLGVFKPSGFVNNKSVLIFAALMAVFVYKLFGSLLGAAIGAFFLTGFVVLAFQYLVLLPYVIAVWPRTNRQFQTFFDDFSVW